MNRWRNYGLWIILVAILLVALWPVVTDSPANREVIFTVLTSLVLAGSLNILLGYTGYVNFGSIVFFGLGGYAGMYLMSVQGTSLWVAAVGGGLAAALVAFLLGKAILHLRGAYFALATIGINEAMRSLVGNLDFLGGPIGLSLNFQIYDDYGGAANALWLVYYIVIGLALLSVIVSYAVKSSKFGLGLQAIREDEDAAEVMGIITPNAKTWAYVLSAILPGVVGVLVFFKNGNIEPPQAFRLHQSIELLVMVMLGGSGS
ncbi:MAG: branched-chain amino acid ABC transporter permease, partial [Chloroflexota bacterium]